MSKKSKNKNKQNRQTKQQPVPKVKILSQTTENMSVDNLDYIEARINYKNLGLT